MGNRQKIIFLCKIYKSATVQQKCTAMKGRHPKISRVQNRHIPKKSFPDLKILYSSVLYIIHGKIRGLSDLTTIWHVPSAAMREQVAIQTHETLKQWC